MSLVTRTPRLLVKLPSAPNAASFQFAGAPLNVRFEPLFRSIRPASPGSGVVAPGEWHIMSQDAVGAEVNVWDLCHALVTEGFGVAGLAPASFAEPDLAQQWTTATPSEHALAAARTGDQPDPPYSDLPSGDGWYWFRDSDHSQLEQARDQVGEPENRIRIAHFDTGYDPRHCTRPKYLLTQEPKNLQRNFVDDDSPNDAIDHSSGIMTNLGHGTGTLSLLAGAAVDGSPLGGAPFQDVIPIRVANSVVLFWNSAIARAFDYVHSLFADPTTRVHVITMSMGGLASQAWAEAVNALYELGVFIVTAAGNNYGNLPTRHIVFPARFGRVVAACGVMADGRPYADLPLQTMAGNYGPGRKMRTAMAAYTPNTPWARFGWERMVDHDGQGTSAATPQIAAAAALYIQKHKTEWESKYPEGWMRVEAVRRALFKSARNASAAPDEKLGRGLLQAATALAMAPAESTELVQEPPDSASFSFLRVITGLGVAAAPDARQRMLELEALQHAQQSYEIERLLPDPDRPEQISAADRQRIIELLHDAPGASRALRKELAKHVAPVVAGGRPARSTFPCGTLPLADRARLEHAMNPPVAEPASRKLRVFAFDPLLGYSPETLELNETVLDIKWEELQPGPVGEYLEVVDNDPGSGCSYAPVDLTHPAILAGAGLPPSEASPYFHQQMCYAVAMKTIAHFERALGRVALWAPRFVKYAGDGGPRVEQHYIQRLRIYPHALREENSFYSPQKKALLLGYFNASATEPGGNLPGGVVFCALSHDIIAHETTHALLDGLHRYFGEPTNQDVLAFHEAFADIVALFQHFTIPEALRDQIRQTRGDLGRQENLLAELACQFGQGIGRYGGLRDYIGGRDKGEWKPRTPTVDDYRNATEPHDRGAVLVAAVFDAFLDIYRRRSADLVRLATGGTGVLPAGAIPHDLVDRLAVEAAKTAGHVLNICIRALDYCPPVNLTFGGYLRALITADYDLVAEDPWGYRAAFVQGFRRRGIYPENVRNLSPGSLRWEAPEANIPLPLDTLRLSWDLHINRKMAFHVSRKNAGMLHSFFKTDPGFGDAGAQALGFYLQGRQELNGTPGELRDFEVHSVRPVRRIGPDGQQRTDIVVEITQSWIPADGSGKFRGGCTLIIDGERRAIRYVVRKRVGNPSQMQEQATYQMAENDLRRNYFGEEAIRNEPFAFLHRSI